MNGYLIFLLSVLGLFLLLMAAGNIHMWRQIQHGRFEYPWNWRVLFGAHAYFGWWDRQESFTR